MKVVALVSGGKDSCYAMMRCLEYGHQIVALANLLPLDDSVDELDSFMYQTVGHQIVTAYTQCMGLPLFRRRIQGGSSARELRYNLTAGDEVEDLFLLLKEVKRSFPSLEGVTCGAIASDYQRNRVENVCSRLNIVSLAYLWKQDQTTLLQQMISSGIEAVLVKVAAIGLDPHKHLGKGLAEMQQLLTHLNNKYGINVCGEGGEYETLTLDCPLFKNFKIVLDEYDIILHSSGTIAPVGVLHPLKFHLESKASELSSLQIPLKPLVSEVRGSIGEDVIEQQDSDACMPMPTSELAGQSVLDLHITSRRLQGSFSTISCWIGTCTSAKGIEDELGLVLASIAGELEKHDLGWGNVLYVHLYIDDMGAFAQANQTYIKHITGDLCIRGVPSRSTVGLSLRNSNLGRVMVEAIATSDMNKKVLHVQSISCWAPSCIGPYSQATLQNGLLYMAGQLGLDPATMVLVSGGAASEMSQALQNCEAVAQAFGTSVKSSSINILIYCSSSISLSEMGEIETVLYKYLGFLGKGDTEAACINVPVLFVRVPALPKGAMLEVEPFLYLPREDEGLALERASFCSASKTCQWDALSCHSSIAARHICRALFSASLHSKSVLLDKVRISSAIHSVPSSFSLSELQGGFNACLQSLSIMLAKAFLCWEDILALRVLFIEEMVSLCSIVEAWKLALNEFAASHVSLIEGEVQMCSNKDGLCSLEPLFLPVLGIGQNSNITDFISVDLLAVRM